MTNYQDELDGIIDHAITDGVVNMREVRESVYRSNWSVRWPFRALDCVSFGSYAEAYKHEPFETIFGTDGIDFSAVARAAMLAEISDMIDKMKLTRKE